MTLFVCISPDDTRAVIIRAEALSDAKLYTLTLFPDVSNRSKVLVTETGDVGQRVDYELHWEGAGRERRLVAIAAKAADGTTLSIGTTGRRP